MENIKKLLNKKSCLIIFLFLLFLIFLIYQHQGMFMYYDDYGYASLSYVYNVEHVKGTNYNFNDIMQFAKGHYDWWGGRMLFLTLEIVIIRYLGLQGFRIIQSIVILGIAVLTYLILKNILKKKEGSIKLAILSIISYGVIEIAVFRSGIFWISASVLYVFPLVSFLLFLYLYIKYKENSNLKNKMIKFVYVVAMGIAIFAATFSQEQVAIAAITLIAILTIYNTVKNKKISKLDIIMCLVALLGFAILMLAPGNEARKSSLSSGGFYEKPFIQRTIGAYKPIVIKNFNGATKIFSLLFFSSVAYCSFKNVKEKKGMKWLNHISCISIVIILGLSFICPDGYFGTLLQESQNKIKTYGSIVLSILQVILMFYSLSVYFWNKKHIYFVAILYAGIISQVCMLVAPGFPERSAIIFEVLMNLLMIKILIDIRLEYKQVYYYLAIPIIIICCLNSYRITKGYHANISVNQYNDTKLLETKQKIDTGEKIEKVTLKKLKDDRYGYDQLYQGISMIKTYICEYYDLPAEIEIQYEE